MGDGTADDPPSQILDTDALSESEVSTEVGSTEGFDGDDVDAGVDGGEPESPTAVEEIAAPPVAVMQAPKTLKLPLAFAGFLDPGSALGWGASAGFEVGRKSSFVLSVRVPNAGLFPYGAQGEDSDFEWGLGVAVGLRRYFRADGSLRGVYFGGSLEYLRVAGRRDVYDWRYAYFGPSLQVGYRFVFGRFCSVWEDDSVLCSTFLENESTISGGSRASIAAPRCRSRS